MIEYILALLASILVGTTVLDVYLVRALVTNTKLRSEQVKKAMFTFVYVFLSSPFVLFLFLSYIQSAGANTERLFPIASVASLTKIVIILCCGITSGFSIIYHLKRMFQKPFVAE